MAGRSQHPGVAGDKRRVQQLRQGHVRRIVGGEVSAQLPDAGKQDIVIVPFQGHRRELEKAASGAVDVELLLSHETPENLGHLYVDQMRSLKHLPPAEQARAHRALI